MEWVERKVDQFSLSHRSVLEIGSADVNGSIRRFFTGDYMGVDLAQGPGVDFVVEPGIIPFSTGSFDVVVTTEMLEHDPRPWETFKEIARLLRYNGTLILTCRGYDAQRGAFPVHNPPDYWRFSAGALRSLASEVGLTVVELMADPQCPGWFMVGALSSSE
jgi:SAM-dependent methyltransferase